MKRCLPPQQINTDILTLRLLKTRLQMCCVHLNLRLGLSPQVNSEAWSNTPHMLNLTICSFLLFHFFFTQTLLPSHSSPHVRPPPHTHTLMHSYCYPCPAYSHTHTFNTLKCVSTFTVWVCVTCVRFCVLLEVLWVTVSTQDTDILDHYTS